MVSGRRVFTNAALTGLSLGGESHFYTDVGPLGLKSSGHRVTIDISPRWG